jgi:hypothetical protein
LDSIGERETLITVMKNNGEVRVMSEKISRMMEEYA